MTVFYRKYRPQKFSDLVGRDSIAKTLLSQLESGKVGHGYLFYGTRGTGKTSSARILAKAVNCEVYGKKDSRENVKKFGEPCNKCLSCKSITDGSNLDLIEIDAASNRGIDEIRDLREKVKLSPVSSRFKVYIIDEAHMLTNEAFNALLKTLEEPPNHAIFILATTDYAKLPATIVSRLQKFNFTKARDKEIVDACRIICKKEEIKIDEDALAAIARAADGSFRDAVSILDQVSSKKTVVKKDDVLSVAKATGENQIFDFAQKLSGYQLRDAVSVIEDLAGNGADIVVFARQVVLALERILLVKLGLENESFLEADSLTREKIKDLAEAFEREKLQELIRLLIASEADIKQYPLSHIPLVLAVCRYCQNESEENAQQVKVNMPLRKVEESKEAQREEEIKVSKIEPKKEPKIIRASAKSAKALADVEKSWPEFLNKVRPINAHVVALLRSTKPTNFDGNSLTLEVFYRFHKDKLEEPRIVSILDSIMGEVMGSPVRLKFTLASRENPPTIAALKSDVVDADAQELEQIAQEIFSK